MGLEKAKDFLQNVAANILANWFVALCLVVAPMIGSLGAWLGGFGTELAKALFWMGAGAIVFLVMIGSYSLLKNSRKSKSHGIQRREHDQPNPEIQEQKALADGIARQLELQKLLVLGRPSDALPDRVFLDKQTHPIDLMKMMAEGATQLLGRKIVEPFVNKWYWLDGQVHDVTPGYSSDSIMVSIYAGTERGWASISAMFDKRFLHNVEHLKAPSRIKFIGQIVSINSSGMILYECEPHD